MKVIMAGATGFIGAALRRRLGAKSHTLVLLSRNPRRPQNGSKEEWVHWEPGTGGVWEHAVDGADGIINLAGEPIAAKRWTPVQKERIRSSRIDTTKSLVHAIGKAKVKPKFMISSSAVGYYGPRGDETLTEESPPGNDFLSRLCGEWEEEALKAEGTECEWHYSARESYWGRAKALWPKWYRRSKCFSAVDSVPASSGCPGSISTTKSV